MLDLWVVVSLAVERLGNLQDLFGTVFPTVGALFASFGNYEYPTHRFRERRLIDGLADNLPREETLRILLWGPMRHIVFSRSETFGPNQIEGNFADSPAEMNA